MFRPYFITAPSVQSQENISKDKKYQYIQYILVFDYNLTIVYYDEKQVKMLEIKWRKKHDC